MPLANYNRMQVGWGCAVLGAFRNSKRMSAWVALAAAYVLALHVLLASFAPVHAMAAGNPATDGLSVICYGAGHDGAGAGDTGDVPAAPAKQHQPACFLCSVAKGSLAILPLDHCIGTLDVRLASFIAPRSDGPIVQFHSPTGRYQRGPPAVLIGAA